MREQQSGLGHKQYYARKLPTLTQQQIIAAARQQALHEADESYSGHSAGIHPENRPFLPDQRNQRTRASAPVADDYDLEEDERYYTTRSQSSARRYDTSGNQIIRQGNRKYVIHDGYPPVKQRQLPPPRQQYEQEPEPWHGTRRRFRFHPLVYIGFVLFLMLAGWVAVSALGNFWQAKQDDWTYGQQRHFTMNAVVGHSDSSSSPSHFIAENNNGNIFVIELPGGDASRAKIYQITTIPGNDGNPPVKVTFQDINHDGKPDMLVQIGDPGSVVTIILFNNGSQFVSKL